MKFVKAGAIGSTAAALVMLAAGSAQAQGAAAPAVAPTATAPAAAAAQAPTTPSAPTAAATPAPKPTPTAEQVETTKKVMAQMHMIGMSSRGKEIADHLIEQNQKMLPQSAEAIGNLKQQVEGDFQEKLQEAEDNAVTIFAKHFTAEEINGVSAFLDSTTGQAWVREMPAIQNELRANTQKTFGPAIQAATARINDAAGRKPSTGALGALGVTEPKEGAKDAAKAPAQPDEAKK